MTMETRNEEQKCKKKETFLGKQIGKENQTEKYQII